VSEGYDEGEREIRDYIGREREKRGREGVREK
jgi:hypothetical protein